MIKVNDNILVFFAVAVPVAAFIYVHMQARIMFSRIELGAPKAEVARILGEPDKLLPSMMFCDENLGWSGECPDKSYPEYQFFKSGIDRWVVFGISREGRVAFKTMGDL